MMKYFNILATLLLISSFSFYGCNDNTRKKTPVEIPQPTSLPVLPNSSALKSATPEPAQNATGIWHYTCSNGCAGGAGAAGNCSNCGNPLAHNSAYHANSGAGAGAGSGLTLPSSAPTAATTGMNAAGVYHYTCGNGCAGGAAAAGTCGSCGGTLAHNAAYHN